LPVQLSFCALHLLICVRVVLFFLPATG